MTELFCGMNGVEWNGLNVNAEWNGTDRFNFRCEQNGTDFIVPEYWSAVFSSFGVFLSHLTEFFS